MRTKMMVIVSLALLSLPGVLWSVEQSSASNAQYARLRGGPPTASPAAEKVLRIYELRYYPAGDLANIIRAVIPRDEVNVVQDERENRLIVTAPQARLEQISDLIATLDTTTIRQEQTRQMMCRVYMLELPSESQRLKPFDLTIETDKQLPATSILNTASDPEVQIDMFSQQTRQPPDNEHHEYRIQGRAASNEAIKHMLEAIGDTTITELRWEDDAFTVSVPAAQVTQLSASLQNHIRSLLGEGVQTVGYWFGNLSLPGEVRAPIGVWGFELNAEPDQNDELRLEVGVTQESRGGARPREILSNSVRGKIGKPIIIGYNRDRGGTRVMGAMAVVPEMDTAPAGAASETKNF